VPDDFFRAVQLGDVGRVRAGLAAGISANAIDSNGFTPLINAAIFGQVEVARIFLAAGADPLFRARSHLFREGKTTTALDQARGNGHKHFVELLQHSGAVDADPAQFAYDALKGLAEAASSPAYKETIDLLSVICGETPRPWKRRRGIFQATVKRLDALHAAAAAQPAHVGGQRWESSLDWLQTKVREAGFLLVQVEPYRPAAPIKLRLWPTAEKYAVIAGSGTNGINYGHTTRDIIAWLLDLDRENPFILTACSFDYLAGKFKNPAKNTDHWAEKMLRFCPDLGMPPPALAQELRATQHFGFWWD
jgi:hypothetical protein